MVSDDGLELIMGVDRVKTEKNVISLFIPKGSGSSYRESKFNRLVAMSGISNLKSPEITDMPTGGSVDQHGFSEKRLLAIELVNEILKCVNNLPNTGVFEYARTIAQMAWVEQQDEVDILAELEIEKTWYYELRKRSAGLLADSLDANVSIGNQQFVAYADIAE